jgi:hypothetical protein
MASPDYTLFKGITSYSDVQLMSNIEHNLKMWLDWSLLNIGAWTNATGYSGTYYGHPSKLNWVKDASFATGQVWQSNRKDWVWETGINFNGSLNPIIITGVEINGTGNSGNYSINYPLGRVIFTGAINTGSIITAKYSYKNVQVYRADDAPWWKELQYRSFDSNDSQFKQDPRTGDWSIGAYQRIQLPAIIIETVSKGESKGYEIGNGSLEVNQDVLFHVLADNRRTRNDLVSILFLQNDKYIWLFDSNIINSGQHYPLTASGTKQNGLLYPNFVSATGFRDKKCRFTKTTMSEVQSVNTNLYEGVVRTTLNVVFGDI